MRELLLTSIALWPVACVAGVCDLAPSGPIRITQDYQVVHGLSIRAYGATPGVDLQGHFGVVIYSSKILHGAGPGILVNGGSAGVYSVNITGASTTKSGSNIDCRDAWGLTVGNVRLTHGNRGINLLNCDGPQMSGIEGHDEHDINGSYSYGALVEFNNSNYGWLDNFSNDNSPSNLAGGDVVNVYWSSDTAISNGSINRVNGIYACGVEVDEGSSHTAVWSVDIVGAVNCGFAAYGSGGDDAAFWNVRVRDTAPSSVQGPPSSGGWAFIGPCDPAADPNCTTTKTRVDFNGEYYWNLYYPSTVALNSEAMVTANFVHADFTPNAPFIADVCP